MDVFTSDGWYSAFGDHYPVADFPRLVSAAPKGLFMTGTPAIETTPSSQRTALCGHTFGASLRMSAGDCGRGGAPLWWKSSACLGPAG